MSLLSSISAAVPSAATADPGPPPAAEVGAATPSRATTPVVETAPAAQQAVPKPAVVAPRITSIGGVTNAAAGINNGLVDMSTGTRWNGYRVVNDQAGLYRWTIRGTNFGNVPGQVRLGGRTVPIVPGGWTNTKIVIDPSGAQINPARPWDWAPRGTTLVVQTATGQQISQVVNIAPAIRSRIFQQCTWHVAKRRIEMNMTPSPTAYGNYSEIGANWVPRRGDQLKWGGTAASGGYHQAIIESVSRPIVIGKVTSYTLTISQYNANGGNEFSTFTTTFQVTGKTVTARPRFSAGSGGATGYWR